MFRLKTWIARGLPVILALLLAACGGSDSGEGEGLIAPPTRTPAPTTSGNADPDAAAADDANIPAALRMDATRIGRGTAESLGWSADGLIVSGSQGLWRYGAFAPDGSTPDPDLLATPVSGAAVFSLTGAYLAARGPDGTLAVWDSAGNAPLFALETGGERAWVATFSADESLVAAAILPPEDATLPAEETDLQTGTLPTGTVIRTWEIASGAVRDEYALPDDRLLDLAFDDANRLIAAGSAINLTTYEFVGPNQPLQEIPPLSSDNSVRLWDLAAGEVRATVENLEYGLFSATLSPGAAYFAAPAVVTTSQYGTDEWRLHVWDAESGALLHGFDADSTGSYDVHAFSPDGALLAAVVNARDDDTVTSYTQDEVWLWNLVTGDLHAVLTADAFPGDGRRQLNANRVNVLGQITTLAMRPAAPDRFDLAALGRDGTVAVWETTPAPEGREAQIVRADFMGGVAALAFSDDSARLLVSSGGSLIRVWDTVTGAVAADPIAAAQMVGALVNGPGGLLVAETGQSPVRLQFWDDEGAVSLGVLQNDYRSLRFWALHPDGQQVITGRGGGTLNLWNTTTQAQDGVLLAGHQVTAMAFSPDGSRLATGGLLGTIKIWDSESGDELASYSGHNGAVSHLAFSRTPDGLRLTSASLDRIVMPAERWNEADIQGAAEYTLRHWDVDAGTLAASFDFPADSAPVMAAFSADGARLVTVEPQGDALALVLRSVSEPAQPLARESLDAADVTALALAPDNAQIATGHSDGTVTLWTVATSAE